MRTIHTFGLVIDYIVQFDYIVQDTYRLYCSKSIFSSFTTPNPGLLHAEATLSLSDSLCTSVGG